ncbi:hypothetical protein [Marisediminicola senii]|uniref:hypothetical protein n=1 Tax=Marisediminicola senii TaxID=2711233 RepID=UPI0013EC90D4|nr:hypothetical protein [Marisediminicola senii]
MPDPGESAQQSGDSYRLRLTLRKPRIALWWNVRPTVVIDGLGHPAQWGTGTWQVTRDRTGAAGASIGVYLFNRVWRFGAAQLDLDGYPEDVEYVAPVLPFLPGRLRQA